MTRPHPYTCPYCLSLLCLIAGTALACSSETAQPTPTAITLPPTPTPITTYWTGPTTYEPEDIASLERVSQTLVPPPALPQHQQVNSGSPRVVQVRMVIEEKEIEIAPGVFIWAFTFDGSVPGPIIVVHEGDYVELTLVNPDSNALLHNVDFHASI